MRKAIIMTTAGILAAGLGGAVAANKLGKDVDRPDCPGKIVCPITGDVICADQCPLETEARTVALPVAGPEALPACCAGTTSDEN
jgi:hypothetical protein